MGSLAEADEANEAVPGSFYRRVARNLWWLLGSQGFTAALSIVYFGIAARSLGPRGFGEFTLVLTYGQLIANLTQFQSWKGVIRFGAVHLERGQRSELARLGGFMAVLDWSTAIVGALLAVIAVPLVGPLLHWSSDEQMRAAIFAGVLLLTSGGTPTGLLRLYDRFDLLAISDGIAPLTRIIGAVLVWATGGGVLAFLMVWASAAVAQALSSWAAVLFVEGVPLKIGRRSFKQAVGENRRLWKFMIQTNLSSSVGLFWLQTGTLAIGAYVGPVAAGGFRIASRIAKAAKKPVEMLTRAMYPEFARLVASDDRQTLRKVMQRTVLLAALLAVVLVIFVAFAGPFVLKTIAGPRFAFAQTFLLLLAISTAIDLAGFALEPFHNAHGRSGRVLRTRIVGAIVYVIALVLLLPRYGAVGVAVTSIITSAVLFAQLAQSTVQLLRGKAKLEPEANLKQDLAVDPQRVS